MRFALVLSEVGQGLRRNFSMVVSVVLVTFLSLTFVGAAVVLQLQIGAMKSFWYDKAQVAVYLCSPADLTGNCDGEISEDDLAAVQDQLDGDILGPFIKEFYFEDVDQAYENFQNQFKNSPVADYVTKDLMSQTFWLNLEDPTQAAVVTEALAGQPGVQSIVDQRSYLDQIFRILNAGSYTAIAVAAVMLIAAVLLIGTTIRLSAISRKREIAIMRLVGASNRFIQTPFILEGVLAGLIGALMACGAVWGIVHFFVRGYLQTALPSISFVSVTDSWLVAPLLIAVGVLLSGVSAKIAISRYLRV